MAQADEPGNGRELRRSVAACGLRSFLTPVGASPAWSASRSSGSLRNWQAAVAHHPMPDQEPPTPEPLLPSADAIARRNRADLFIGVVAPTGIQRDSFRAQLTRALDRFGYKLETWKVSDLLELFKDVAVDRSTPGRYLETAMEAGSALRSRIGPDCLARAVMLAISKRRQEEQESRDVAAKAGETPSEEPPRVHMVWSLKHKEEVATLRLAYGASFHLVGLYATRKERRSMLLDRPGMTQEAADAAIDRDEDESGRRHGQKTRDTFQLSDVFIPWGKEPDHASLDRFLDLIFGCPTRTPTLDEHRMFLAFSTATRSGELSRQVGAVLADDLGDVLAIGSNDVPRRKGGSYWPTPDDQRDIVKGFDANTRNRDELMRTVARELGAGNSDDLADRLTGSSLKHITEFGRAVHAEMDALLACARTGRSTRRTTMYVTTFPCHNCARHIVAAGVSRIVFVEPYPKSRAIELHDDDLVEVPPGASEDEKGRVRLEPFVGIGPRRFFDYFSMSLGSGYLVERKTTSADLARWVPSEIGPRTQAPEEGYLRTEAQLARELKDFLK